ncbi:unnamed protein product [Nippostrongylus brasiliensis]|uniref:Putative choline/ethanolamine kinase (inferred by orthology to a S. mansoni protein) n=1 Tax=Nippostrongylus brasiliensis TaxID=27835 RepID=A0A0N4YLY6_NIPBR|nr:unnamed protein product [Nippostrongylus brasiliensis]
MATQVNDSHDSDVSLLTIFSMFNSDTTDSVILNKARELCAEYLGGVWGQIDSTKLKLKRMRLRGQAIIGEWFYQTDLRYVVLKVFFNFSMSFFFYSHGFGPKLLAVFPGGRVEEFIPSRNLTKEESLDKNFIRNIAKLTAEINDVDMPLPKSPQFVTLFPAVVTIDDLENELDEIDAFMKAQKGPSVFCHNDIVPSNVLVKTGIDGEEESFDYDRLVIIDFEFAIYNLRFVINKSAGNLGIYPTAVQQRYINDHDTPEKRKQNLLTGDRQKDLEMLRSEGRRFLALPHFFWGIWNIICMEELEGSFEFGYVPHAKDRLIMYYRFKENMYKY